MVILVTGASGQLGQAIAFIADEFPDVDFHFADSKRADITDKASLSRIFTDLRPDYCINAAAYTAVDKAESEPEKANAINVTGAKNLAEICADFDCTLLHISTDFVFDGQKKSPYTESDQTNPLGVYGRSKRDGENEIVGSGCKFFIIRTSWVYSQFGGNFMKTMLRLASEKSELNIVNDQIGSPTHAVDLARTLVSIAISGKTSYGIYNFSNEGEASWYDFAMEIFRMNDISINVEPIPTTTFPTAVKRPAYSVLDKSKIKTTFGLEIRDWKQALAAN